MIVTFCGHADFQRSDEYEKKIFDFFEKNIGEQSTEVYLGGYGAFDEFAYKCCKKYKATHPNMFLIFVTPYINVEYQELEYDSIIYPDIEDKPLKLAILYRNRYMVEKADCVIAFVARPFGGAYKTYKHARNKKKHIFNLADFE